MRRYILFFRLLFFGSIAIIGCQKQSNIDHDATRVILDESKIYQKPSTEAEKNLVANLGKLTEVLKELYKDNKNLKLVNAAIFSGAYTDESVLVKDLIFPENSFLSTVPKFKKYSEKFEVSLNSFAEAFWKVSNNTKDIAFLNFLNSLNRPNSSAINFRPTLTKASDDVSIYFPYSEGFQTTSNIENYSPITTLVTATADADEGWGSQPYYINGVIQNYTKVLVNDSYAETHPTQIVGVNGIEPYNSQLVENRAFPPSAPIDLPNLPREVKQVYIGDVKIHNKQYDRFISFTGNGGGSEIVFTRSDGFHKNCRWSSAG